MNKNNMFGIGIVLAMLLVFAAPAAADNVIYFDPDPSCAAPGEEINVTLYVDTTEGSASMDTRVYTDMDVVEIIDGRPGDYSLMWYFVPHADHIRIGGWSHDGLNLDPGTYVLAYFTLRANNTGTSDIWHFYCHLDNQYGMALPNQVWTNNGTFTCTGPPTTFTKSLPVGWNLISLPLMPSDNSVSAVLGGVSYTVVYSYNATSKQFECPTTMDPEIGYFVDVTSASTWEYEGTPVSTTSHGLKSGLNMIGVPNCTMNVSDAMGSADYRYVARWNTTAHKFEVYNPSAPVAFRHFDSIEAGEGYFISAKSDDVTFAISCPPS